ncbi:MAG: TauD/TfdA family dioxygenase [Acidimicrobiales bacterium]|nr:TauD/TfdA family dioxygenase [Acidimicrobiales bacterium]RZV48392.1 MAG: TauD/TfdA family dioxygenase [Acidimicrobiales bacterium]
MSSLAVHPNATCGAFVYGVDLANLTLAEFDQIKAAFAEHGVLFFRDQDLTTRQHIEFAECWGEINVNRFFTAHMDHPEIAIVAKEPDDETNIGGYWHSDHSYDVEPALGSILVARELPTSGGDTQFASMRRAYEQLDTRTKHRIERLRAVHSVHHVFGAEAYAGAERGDFTDRLGNSDGADEMVDVAHPMVIRHPLSGKNVLYVNPTFTIAIEGMDHGEAMGLLHGLYDHATSDDFTFDFVWEPGSVAMWDNRAVWHSARNDYPGQRRVMHRITIEGCALEAPPELQRADPTLAQRAGATIAGGVVAATMDGIGMVIEPERTKRPDIEIVGEAPEDEPHDTPAEPGVSFGDLPEI